MLYWVIRAIMGGLVSALFGLEVSGRENVPSSGPVVVCSNHIAWLDPVVLAKVFPFKISFMAKEELFRYPVFGQVLRAVGAFPVKRGKADRGAIQAASAVLRQGGALGMFPEGTRSRTGEMGKGHNGAAYVAVRNRAAVLPVAIVGPYRIGRPVTVNIGKAMTLTGGGDRVSSQEMGEAAARVMEAIAGLLNRRRVSAGQPG